MDDQQTIEIQRRADALVAVVRCETFDHQSTADLQRELFAVTEEPSTLPVLMDLSSVAFMGSVTLGALVQIASRCRKQKRRVALVGLAPPLRRIMEVTALQNLFEMHDCIDDALQQ